ncbi:MAG: enoyl-CoA hydratase/isomerase family protein [Nocardioides sp.]|nr:enoyl-CoA hydratase/isomerase family protein [Nocardioides sp.]
MSDILLVDDRDRVRTLTLNRPDALNAFDDDLYNALATALREAAEDSSVAVVLLTGAGRAFSAGQDLTEMAELSGEGPGGGIFGDDYGFIKLLAALDDFDKPLVLAINGLGLGIGLTIIGYADLVLMASNARLKTPFTSLGVAPEAASSYLLPRLVGRQNAAWILLSSEWITAQEAHEMGLVWRVCEPDALLEEAHGRASTIARMPISSLRAVKQTMTEPLQAPLLAARARENDLFAKLMGGPANTEALTAFLERRDPDFTNLPDE